MVAHFVANNLNFHVRIDNLNTSSVVPEYHIVFNDKYGFGDRSLEVEHFFERYTIREVVLNQVVCHQNIDVDDEVGFNAFATIAVDDVVRYR